VSLFPRSGAIAVRQHCDVAVPDQCRRRIPSRVVVPVDDDAAAAADSAAPADRNAAAAAAVVAVPDAGSFLQADSGAAVVEYLLDYGTNRLPFHDRDFFVFNRIQQ